MVEFSDSFNRKSSFATGRRWAAAVKADAAGAKGKSGAALGKKLAGYASGKGGGNSAYRAGLRAGAAGRGSYRRDRKGRFA